MAQTTMARFGCGSSDFNVPFLPTPGGLLCLDRGVERPDQTSGDQGICATSASQKMKKTICFLLRLCAPKT